MAKDWREGFKRALIDALIKEGSPLDPKPDAWGWIAPDWEEVIGRVREVGIDYERSTWTESQWSEFMGTFYEGDTRKVGIDATIALKDGSTVAYRYSGTAGDLIVAVVADL